MLANLIKYDLKYIYKLLGIYYIIVVLGAIIFLATDFEPTNGIVEFIHYFAGGASFGLSIGLFINAITRNWMRFQKNFYGDEAYLTHTLPVTKSQLLLSKTISSLVVLIASLILLIFCVITTQIGFTALSEFNNMLESQGYNIFSLGGLLFITIALQQFFIIECGFSGILIGHRKNDRRAMWSWITGVGIYIIANLLIIGVTLIWSLFDTDIHNFIFSGESQSLFALANISKVIIGIDVCYFIIVLALYHLSRKTLDRGVDVE